MPEGEAGGGAGTMTESPSGLSMTIPNGSSGSVATAPPVTPGGSVATMPAFLDSIPAEYRDKPWIQDTARNEKPWEALVKGYDNLHTKLGQRTEGGLQVPGDDATDDQRKAFHKALGVPDDVAGYDYKGLDVSKEPEAIQRFMESSKDDAFLNNMKTQAHKMGITPKQFNALAEAFDQHSLGIAKESTEGFEKVKAERGAKQMETYKSVYGDKADEVMTTAKATIEKAIPENIRATGDMEIILYEALRIINEKLYKNDTINPTVTRSTDDSPADIHQKILTMRKDPAFKDFTHRNHAELNKQIDSLYQQMHELKKGGN